MNHQAEALRKESEEINRGIDQAFNQPSPEQRQQELARLVEAAHRLLGKVRQAKGGDIECTISTSKASSPVCENSNCTGRTSRTCAG